MIDNVQVPPFSQSFIPSRITRDGAVTAVLGSRAARASAAACGCAPGARDSCIMTMYFLVINQSHGVWFLKLNEHIRFKRVGKMDGAALLVRGSRARRAIKSEKISHRHTRDAAPRTTAPSASRLSSFVSRCTMIDTPLSHRRSAPPCRSPHRRTAPSRP